MATQTLTAALSTVIKEEIPRGIREQRIKIDPVWTDIISSGMGVERSGLGRDWKFLLTLTTGISGAYEFKANSVLVGAAATYYNGAQQFGAGNTWPARSETTAPVFFQRTITLKEARGNLIVPLKWMQLDEFDSSIGPAVKQVLLGAARKAALAHAISFYTTDATNFKLVYNLAASGAAASHTVTIDNSDATKAHGRIAMIHNGMTVDLVDAGDDVADNDSPWLVTSVDYINQKFVIEKIGGTNTALVSGGYLVLRNSQGNQPSGLLSWMVDASAGSQTVFGIDCDAHPEFGSLISTSESGPLTEKILTKYIGSFLDRIGTMCDLDTVITPAAVVHSYLENEDNLARYERNGRRLSVKGGWADIDYAYQGQGFRWAISTFVEPTSCYVLKLGGGTIREYVPPATPGAGHKSEFENEFQFVAPLGGANSVFLHERSSDAITDNFEAPFFRICEIATEQPQGIRLTGFDESEA